MKSEIENAIPENAINEIAGECLIQGHINKAYNEFRKKSRKYLNHDDHEHVVSLLFMNKNYLKSICMDFEERFHHNQSVILTCSKELIRDGLIFPIYNEKMTKTLSEIVKDFHKDNCTSFHRIVKNLMSRLEKCQDTTEHQTMKTLLEFVPKDGCLELNDLHEHVDLTPPQKGIF